MLRVWLPSGYSSPDRRNEPYAVMYLNDGQNLFDACTSIFNHGRGASMRQLDFACLQTAGQCIDYEVSTGRS
jgi:predicted alpha/beta superfamily hydrolase